jgi:hypothetical protein
VRWWPEFLALAGYVVLVATMTRVHEPFADEGQAWQIARSVPIWEIFRDRVRYEGSPGLWHLLLAILSRLHVSYTGMHWVCAAIAVTSTSLLIFRSNFPRAVRLLLPFSFFLAYQYAVIARSYVLVPLLLFTMAAFWRRIGPLTIAVLLGLLGNVSMHAMGISGGLALLYLWEVWRGTRRVDRGRLIGAVAIVTVMYGFALWSVLPTGANLSYVAPAYHATLTQKILEWPRRTLRPLLFALFVPKKLALLIWVIVAARFAQMRKLIYLLPVLTLGLLFAYYFGFWHMGLLFPTGVAVWWIAGPQERPTTLGKIAAAALLCIVVMETAWTAYAVRFDWFHNYSPDAETARFLAPRLAAGDKVALDYVANPDLNAFYAIGIQPYFDHPIFMNERRPYWLWSSKEHTNGDLGRALDERPPIVVSEFMGEPPFNPKDVKGIRVENLQRLGYHMTHAFCGAKVESFKLVAESCHLIYER